MALREAIDAYRNAIAMIGERVIFVRVTGVAPNATTVSVPVKAIVRDYVPAAAVMEVKREGAITQGMRHLIVIERDLQVQGFPTPLAKNDKAVVRGEQLNINSVDASKRGYAGATEVVAGGV